MKSKALLFAGMEYNEIKLELTLEQMRAFCEVFKKSGCEWIYDNEDREYDAYEAECAMNVIFENIEAKLQTIKATKAKTKKELWQEKNCEVCFLEGTENCNFCPKEAMD